MLRIGAAPERQSYKNIMSPQMGVFDLGTGPILKGPTCGPSGDHRPCNNMVLKLEAVAKLKRCNWCLPNGRVL